MIVHKMWVERRRAGPVTLTYNYDVWYLFSVLPLLVTLKITL